MGKWKKVFDVMLISPIIIKCYSIPLWVRIPHPVFGQLFWQTFDH